MLQTATGISSGDEGYGVAVEAATAAISKINGPVNIAIVLASTQYDQEQVLRGIRSVVGAETRIIGASTAGEITQAGPAKRHSVAVMLFASDTIRFYVGRGDNIAGSPHDAGAAMASSVKQAAGDDELKLLVMFPDVLAGNGAETVRGVLSQMGDHFPVVGGASGDDFKFEKTYQYLDDEVLSGAVVGLGLAGDVKFGIGVKHGWIPIGAPLKVTKSEGSVLHELDGKPAISVYEDYFGAETANELRKEALATLAITYPLGMRVEGSDELLIRDPITVDEHGSITCAAEIPENSEIRLMVGSREEAVKVAEIAGQKALEDLDGAAPKAVLIFNCIARNKLFGDNAPDEIQAIQKAVGADTPLLGFYTYGEQAPLEGQVRNIERCNPAFHNETVVIVTLAE